MTGREALLEALARDRVMAIVRYREGGGLQAAVDALLDGGVRTLEVTIDTPGALEVIAATAGRDDVLVGAGTVLTPDDVGQVAEAGARFVVSPGFNPDVEAAAQRRNLGTLPGVATATEVMSATRAGVRVAKLFPAGVLGSGYLRELRGPFPAQRFVPTGGVGLDDIAEWLEAGALAVAIGSSLAGRTAPKTAEELVALRDRARRAIELARGWPSVPVPVDVPASGSRSLG